MADDKKPTKPGTSNAQPKPQGDKSTARQLTTEELKDVAGGTMANKEEMKK